MGAIIAFPGMRRHVRASSTAGRGTSEGQVTSSGHRAENQQITSSYLRAVNVLPSSSKRSKKRQSPAAKRPKVARLTARAVEYADAQAIKLERSSDSMETNPSRNFPTMQEKSVGTFRLAPEADKSDKSAMPTVDQIRNNITRALAAKEIGAVAAAVELGWERNYLRDFLEGDKNSLKAERIFELSEFLELPIKDLLITKDRKLRRTG